MTLGNRKCNSCGCVFPVWKQDLESWSELSFECPDCKSDDTYTKYGLGDTAVGIGKCGNEKTGYGSEFISRPGKFGYFKGTRVDRSKS